MYYNIEVGDVISDFGIFVNKDNIHIIDQNLNDIRINSFEWEELKEDVNFLIKKHNILSTKITKESLSMSYEIGVPCIAVDHDDIYLSNKNKIRIPKRSWHDLSDCIDRLIDKYEEIYNMKERI